MKQFAKLVRALQRESYYTVDQAAVSAAKDKFPAEFEPNRYPSYVHTFTRVRSRYRYPVDFERR
jgi:hypothetical protein